MDISLPASLLTGTTKHTPFADLLHTVPLQWGTLLGSFGLYKLCRVGLLVGGVCQMPVLP